MEQKLKFGRSETEVENGFGRTLHCSGHGTEQKIRFGGSVTKVGNESGRTASVEAELREIKDLAEAWRNDSLGRSGCIVPFRIWWIACAERK